MSFSVVEVLKRLCGDVSTEHFVTSIPSLVRKQILTIGYIVECETVYSPGEVSAREAAAVFT